MICYMFKFLSNAKFWYILPCRTCFECQHLNLFRFNIISMPLHNQVYFAQLTHFITNLLTNLTTRLTSSLQFLPNMIHWYIYLLFQLIWLKNVNKFRKISIGLNNRDSDSDCRKIIIKQWEFENGDK